MVDPLSTAASIVALLQITEAVLTSCYRFVGQVNNAAAEIDQTIRETGSLKVILLDLKDLMDKDGASRLACVNSLSRENDALAACSNLLQELESKLSHAAGPMSLRRRLLWPFESKKVDEILDNIRQQKQTLLLALGGDNTRVTLEIQESLENIQLQEEREKILNWLQCADPTVKHLTSRELYQPGSNHWVLESDTFKEWKRTPGNTLWLHGIPGAGKTIICSTIIEHLEDLCKTQPESRIAYYYYDFNNESDLQIGTLLRSLILQLARQDKLLPDHVRTLYEHCDHGRKESDKELLASTFFELLNQDRQTFITIDALDECPTDERNRFYELITRQIGKKPGRYNFLITSREERDIDEAMAEVGRRVPLHNQSIQSGDVDADVRLHVHRFILENRRLKKWPEELRTEIEEAIVVGTQGMFRWAICQLDLIKNCMQASVIRKKLKDLPRTLDETYDRILNSIPEEVQQIARSALMLLAYSLRPLTLLEVAEAMVVDTEDQHFDPKEHRLNDSRDALEICSSLVTISKVQNDRATTWLSEKNEIEGLRYYSTAPPEVEAIQFAHFSVKEYMILQREKVDHRLSSLRFSDAVAHRHIAESSPIYLLDFSKGACIRQVDFTAFPFLAYAARYWHEHWRRQLFSDKQASVDGLIRRLFDPSQPNSYINFLNIFRPDFIIDKLFDQSIRYSRIGFSGQKGLESFPQPLYYMAQLGHYELSEWLIEKEGCDVNSTRDNFGQPLQIASLSGHERIVKLLLDHGADINVISGVCGYPLQAAAFVGQEHIVHTLLDHGADVNAVGGMFGSALIAACRGDHFLMAQVLLDRGADVNVVSMNQGKALNVAASNGNVQLFRILLQHGADINDTNGGKGSALYAAAEKGALGIVKMLIDEGVDVNLKSGYKCTALQAACSTATEPDGNDHHEVIKFLLKSGADCNIRGGEYGDALQACIEARGTMDILQLLLDHGADINHQGGKYHSAIQGAVYTGNVEAAHFLLDRGVLTNDEVFLLSVRNMRTTVIPRLLERGVNANAQNKDGTVLQIAIRNEDIDTTMALLQDPLIDINSIGGEKGGTTLYDAVEMGNQAIASLLLDRKADVNAIGGDLCHCLCCAACHGNEQMVRLLLENGADINARGRDWYSTPLIAALQNGHDNIFHLLLSQGADINAALPNHKPHMLTSLNDALQTAALKGNEALVRLLLDRGADIKAPEGENGSCLECAIASKNIDLVRFLLDKGANVNSSLDQVALGEERLGCGGALPAAIMSGQKELVPLLIDSGADVNTFRPGECNGSVLQFAVSYGDVELVRLLLTRGANVNIVAGRHGSALGDAIFKDWRADSAQIVQLLLDAGADVNLQGGYYGCPLAVSITTFSTSDTCQSPSGLLLEVNGLIPVATALQVAVIEGDLEVFRLLLSRGADPDYYNGQFLYIYGGFSGLALGSAARYRHDTMLKELLEHGADPCIGESSALATAAYFGNNNAVSVLLDAGADLHSQEGVPGKALKEAARWGFVNTCRVLLDRGADVNAVGGEYGSALQSILGNYQSSRSNIAIPMVNLLMERGANVNLPPSERYTSILQTAIDNGNTQYIDLLLDAGADINAHDPRFGTVLTAAANMSNPVHPKKLLARGADPSLVGGKYGTALQAAAHCQNTKCVSVLLDHGVDVNQCAGKYGYALQAACRGDEEATARLLLERGASVNSRGGKYETALQCAAKRGQLELVRLLLDHGADLAVEGGKYGSALKAAEARKQYHVANFLRRRLDGVEAGCLRVSLPRKKVQKVESRSVIRMFGGA